MINHLENFPNKYLIRKTIPNSVLRSKTKGEKIKEENSFIENEKARISKGANFEASSAIQKHEGYATRCSHGSTSRYLLFQDR